MYDVFLSHAAEDKETVARPLCRALVDRGLSVWLDERELTVGASIRREIDSGLKQSKFGVVVLSASFFSKEWPQRELDALAAKSSSGKVVLLPVWHELDRQAIERFSPLLADVFAVSTRDGVEAVASEIMRAVAKEYGTSETDVKDGGELAEIEIGWPGFGELRTFDLFLEVRRAQTDLTDHCRCTEGEKNWIEEEGSFRRRRNDRIREWFRDGKLASRSFDITIFSKMDEFSLYDFSYHLVIDISPLEAIPVVNGLWCTRENDSWRLIRIGGARWYDDQIWADRISNSPVRPPMAPFTIPGNRPKEHIFVGFSLVAFSNSELVERRKPVRLSVRIESDCYSPHEQSWSLPAPRWG